MTPNKDLKELLSLLKKVAIKKIHKGKGNQFTELTGLIGELSACEHITGYTWAPGPGYDAKDKAKKRIQIKAKRFHKSTKFSGVRISRFGSAKRLQDPDKYDFDIGILVLVDKNFEIAQIWELNQKEIRTRECIGKKNKQNPETNPKLSGLHLSAFIKPPTKPHLSIDIETLKKKLGVV